MPLLKNKKCHDMTIGELIAEYAWGISSTSWGNPDPEEIRRCNLAEREIFNRLTDYEKRVRDSKRAKSKRRLRKEEY